MQKIEAFKILKAKLAAIECEHRFETEGTREEIDGRAEAKTLAAILDFLTDSKISHRASLLRILERYLRKPPEGDTAHGKGPRAIVPRTSETGLKSNKAARWVEQTRLQEDPTHRTPNKHGRTKGQTILVPAPAATKAAACQRNCKRTTRQGGIRRHSHISNGKW